MKVKLISAVALDGAIGKENKLLWHIPEDLLFYKEMTLNKICIVGENTYNSLPEAAKKNRTYFIVDGSGDMCDESNDDFSLKYIKGFASPKAAIDYAEKIQQSECIIVGGAMMYKTSIQYVDECYITWINKIYPDADAVFPIAELFKSFECVSESEWQTSKSNIRYKFAKYIK